MFARFNLSSKSPGVLASRVGSRPAAHQQLETDTLYFNVSRSSGSSSGATSPPQMGRLLEPALTSFKDIGRLRLDLRVNKCLYRHKGILATAAMAAAV
jgi:hypothetical protein